LLIAIDVQPPPEDNMSSPTSINTKTDRVKSVSIGIEPMNKGFAVLAKLFAQVQACFLVSVFIGVFGISSLRVIA
jgi:hypothetical protein